MVNYQNIVNLFNKKYKNYFLNKLASSLELEIWNQIYLEAKLSNMVLEKDLKEMENILYNSYKENDKIKKIK